MERYSKNPAIVEFMDCPTRCDCGNWHELEDGRTPPGEPDGVLICPECYSGTKCPECGTPTHKEELEGFAGMCGRCFDT